MLITDSKAINRMNKQNPWISLLRIFMCFIVVHDHFVPTGDTVPQKLIALIGNVAVSCFMFISFYFMGNDIRYNRYDKLKGRIVRLYIPIIVWNVIYWCVKNLVCLLFGTNDGFYSVKALLEALILTHYFGLAVQLWFLFVQMVILIIIAILLSYCVKEKSKGIVLLVMFALSYILQYTGVNFDLFNGAEYTVKFPLGRIVECIPYAVCGLLFSWYVMKWKTSYKLIVLAAFAAGTFISKFYIPQIADFGDGGLYLFFFSTAICLFAFLLPDVLSGKIRYYINYVGACTMGIYCIHILVGWLLMGIGGSIAPVRNFLHIDTLIFDAIIFGVSLICTVLIKLINSKLKLRWVDYIV